MLALNEIPDYGHQINQIKSEMFGPNVADKYASAITKNLDLGCNFRPCSLDHFYIIHATSSVNKIIPTFQEPKKKIRSQIA